MPLTQGGVETWTRSRRSRREKRQGQDAPFRTSPPDRLSIDGDSRTSLLRCAGAAASLLCLLSFKSRIYGDLQ